jgi:crotonobetainyl-CoA:carnitine CoA-transferase CaiB-like acyl-CoA transferase
MGSPWKISSVTAGTSNPLTGCYRCGDGRFISFVMLQAFHYWPDFCRHIEREDWIDDPRFDSHEALTANAVEASELIAGELAKRTQDEWADRFQTLQGQWTRVQDTLEVAADPQVLANGYMQQTTTRDGVPFELVSTPVQFDGEPAPIARSPEFNEHGDEILLELGLDMDRILELKAVGAVT